MKETFAPGINVNGRTYTPEGWEWILGFALAGCQWAIDIAGEPEFLEKIREQKLASDKNWTEKRIIALEKELQELKNEIKNT